MPDNTSIQIYRKSQAVPITLLVKSVDEPNGTAMPNYLAVTTEDGRPGRIFLNRSEIEAVVVTPAGDPNR